LIPRKTPLKLKWHRPADKNFIKLIPHILPTRILMNHWTIKLKQAALVVTTAVMAMTGSTFFSGAALSTAIIISTVSDSEARPARGGSRSRSTTRSVSRSTPRGSATRSSTTTRQTATTNRHAAPVNRHASVRSHNVSSTRSTARRTARRVTRRHVYTLPRTHYVVTLGGRYRYYVYEDDDDEKVYYYPYYISGRTVYIEVDVDVNNPGPPPPIESLTEEYYVD